MSTLSRRYLTLAGATAVSALLVGCATPAGLLGGRRRGEQPDKRFAKLTEHVVEPVTVSTEMKGPIRLMPGLGIVSGSFIGQGWAEGRVDLPYPDRPVWMHAVLEVSPEPAQALEEAAQAVAELLPPVHPALHHLVPLGAEFKEVAPADADYVLAVDQAQLDPSEARFGTEQLVVCAAKRLVVMTAVLWPR